MVDNDVVIPGFILSREKIMEWVRYLPKGQFKMLSEAVHELERVNSSSLFDQESGNNDQV